MRLLGVPIPVLLVYPCRAVALVRSIADFGRKTRPFDNGGKCCQRSGSSLRRKCPNFLTTAERSDSDRFLHHIAGSKRAAHELQEEVRMTPLVEFLLRFREREQENAQQNCTLGLSEIQHAGLAARDQIPPPRPLSAPGAAFLRFAQRCG